MLNLILFLHIDNIIYPKEKSHNNTTATPVFPIMLILHINNMHESIVSRQTFSPWSSLLCFMIINLKRGFKTKFLILRWYITDKHEKSGPIYIFNRLFLSLFVFAWTQDLKYATTFLDIRLKEKQVTFYFNFHFTKTIKSMQTKI